MEILNLAPKALFHELSGKILSDLPSGEHLLEQLLRTPQYQSDYALRAAVDSAAAMRTSYKGDHKSAVSQLTELIDRVTALGIWELAVINWNHLGNAYMALQVSEKALECYCNVINIEKEHYANDVTSVACYNISVLYFGVEAYDKAKYYADLSIRMLEARGEKVSAYHSKMAIGLSFCIQILFHLNDEDKMHLVYDRLKSLPVEKMSQEARFSLHVAELYYYFYTTDRSECLDRYHRVRALIDDKDIVRQYILINAYVELCQKFSLHEDMYGKQLKSIETLPETPSSHINSVLYKLLYRYYSEIGDENGANRTMRRYISYLEQNTLDKNEQAVYSLETVETLMLDGNVGGKHAVEMKLIAEEAFKTKNELEALYRRMKTIAAIGRKIVSSTDLGEVVDLIHDAFVENIPIEAFILTVADPEKRELRSVAVYHKKKLKSERTVSFDDLESPLAECYRQKRIVVCDDGSPTSASFGKPSGKRLNLMRSHVAMPLIVGDTVIGVSMVQCRASGVYSAREIEFLEQLQPYLSIALNNAVHLWKLEEEISSRKSTQRMLEDEIVGHKRTQKNLQKAYNSLEIISSLDSLTQVSGRRDFEQKFIEMLRRAGYAGDMVSVFMMDIDNFKLYNDTYGHFEGDEVLKSVATVFRQKLDLKRGLSARFGGEEFIGACVGLTPEENKAFAEDICTSVHDLAIPHHATLIGRVTVSIGVAVTRVGSPECKSQIMRVADASLYEAKNTGKNKVVLREIDSSEGESACAVESVSL